MRLMKRKNDNKKSIRWLIGYFLYTFIVLKGRRVDCLGSNQHMKKKFYKNNVGCIIFMMLVYPINVMESCVICEKIMNECQMFYE